MHCPFCNHEDTKVTDSRLAGEGHQVRRRRECLACGERFTTFESPELVMPQVIKNDQTRQPFDEAKLRAGLMKALDKRPVAREQVEALIERIGQRLRALGEREVASRQVGEIVMQELRQLDEIAYVRYASVYHRFHDADSFREQVEPPGKRRRREADAGQMSLLPPQARDKK
ncbi:MAG: transcriptional regulator NrdR [Gammaproteobacteria bacterium]